MKLWNHAAAETYFGDGLPVLLLRSSGANQPFTHRANRENNSEIKRSRLASGSMVLIEATYASELRQVIRELSIWNEVADFLHSARAAEVRAPLTRAQSHQLLDEHWTGPLLMGVLISSLYQPLSASSRLNLKRFESNNRTRSRSG